MLYRHVNGYEMAYVEVGSGPPLVCVHGTLGDSRVWSPVMGPLSRRHRVISISLRHFFPEHWNGVGSDYTISQHVADVIGFIEAMGERVDLMGHSRGGHISFRVAQQRPDLLRRLVLAEPGGDMDLSLDPSAPPPGFGTRYNATAARVAGGDIDGALQAFSEIVGVPWDTVPPTVRQTWRDNVATLVGQANEQRKPFTRSDAEAIKVPTLFIVGGDTSGLLPKVSRALASHVAGARIQVIPGATHFMFEQDPVRYSEAVLEFLA